MLAGYGGRALRHHVAIKSSGSLNCGGGTGCTVVLWNRRVGVGVPLRRAKGSGMHARPITFAKCRATPPARRWQCALRWSSTVCPRNPLHVSSALLTGPVGAGTSVWVAALRECASVDDKRRA